MTKKRLLYEVNSKKYYEASDPDLLIQNIGANATSEQVLNQQIGEHLLHGLSQMGIATQFVERINMHESLIIPLDALPVRFRVRLRADEGYASALGTEAGILFAKPIIEAEIEGHDGTRASADFSTLETIGFFNEFDIVEVKSLITRVSDFLSGVYWQAGAMLVDYHIKFGRQYLDDYATSFVVTDEIAPLHAQIWQQMETPGERPVVLGIHELSEMLYAQGIIKAQ